MKCFQAVVQSQTIEPLGRPAVWIAWLENPPRPNPGQFFLLHPHRSQDLPLVSLPVDIRSEFILLEQPRHQTLYPGDLVQLWGPAGKPFNPPSECQRWLILAPLGHPGRLLPLISEGLKRGAALALWTTQPIPNLPPAVELLSRASDGISWADYIAIDFETSQAFDIQGHGLEELWSSSAGKIEALLTPPMPCGFGGCGLCAVKGKRGWHLACLEGAVFDWKDLEQ